MNNVLDAEIWTDTEWDEIVEEGNDIMGIDQLEAELGIELKAELEELEAELKAELEADMKAVLDAEMNIEEGN